MNKLSRFFSTLTILAIITSAQFIVPLKKAEAFDHNNLCSDAAFINSSRTDTSGIQSFLQSKGSYLARYSQNGKSAAQIINDAAKANGINPVTILAMIQKEEGLITGAYSTSYNQTRYDWAVGYGYTDSEIMTQHAGFTNQINNGTWQLKRNYSYWASNGSQWNVGRSMVIDGTTVTFGNRCTSALYRYTPHLGTNFTYYFNLWNGQIGGGAATGTYDAAFVTQGPRTGAGAPGVNLSPNQRITLWVNYRNTGNATWRQTGTNAVRIGTAGPQDRPSPFMGNKSLRGTLVQPAVKANNIGTFRLILTAPAQAGTYTEKFRPVVENNKWMGEEVTWTFNVVGGRSQNVNGTSTNQAGNSISQANYNATYVTQGPRTGAGSPGSTLAKGQRATLWVNFRNTGNQTWYKNGINPTYLGTWSPNDRNSAFFGGHNIRSAMVQTSVPPGSIGTFVVNITAPQTPGTYTEIFRPVTEHVTWMGDTASWTLRVQ